MVYETEDGELLKGNSPTQLLENLRDGSRFGVDQELEQFLERFLLRIRDYYGKEITTRDHTEIVDELVTVGYWSKAE